MEEKIKTPQTPRRRVFLFVFSQRLGVSALKTAFPSIHIKSALENSPPSATPDASEYRDVSKSA
jgi:hypothetical protein